LSTEEIAIILTSYKLGRSRKYDKVSNKWKKYKLAAEGIIKFRAGFLVPWRYADAEGGFFFSKITEK
jgi:hypothetical protein